MGHADVPAAVPQFGAVKLLLREIDILDTVFEHHPARYSSCQSGNMESSNELLSGTVYMVVGSRYQSVNLILEEHRGKEIEI